MKYKAVIVLPTHIQIEAHSDEEASLIATEKLKSIKESYNKNTVTLSLIREDGKIIDVQLTQFKILSNKKKHKDKKRNGHLSSLMDKATAF